MSGDASWNSVSLLLHCDGSDGSTTFTDSGPDARTVSRTGSPVISTTQSKYGGASASIPGSGNYLTVPADADFDFGTSDFTIECWVYTAATNSFCVALSSNSWSSGSGDWALFTRYDNLDRVVFVYKDDASYLDIRHTTDVHDSAWHHVAITRSGSTLRLFVDGTLKTSQTYAGQLGRSDKTTTVGAHPGDSRQFNGYIDDVRITKGVARYTASFTAPTEAFPEGLPPTEILGLGGSALGSGKALAAHQFINGLGSTPLGSGQAFVAQTNLYGLGGSALGAGKSLTWNQSARVAGGSALGTGKAIAWNQYLRALGGSALGAGKSLNNIPQAARILGGSALGSGKAVGWADFTGAVSETSTLAYVMDLVTPDGNVRVPISSWQATLQTGASSYVQCVIPACSEWIDDIVAATEFVIYRRAELTDGSTIEYEMATAPLEVRNYSQGPFNYTATISGYPDALTAQDDPSPTFDRTLTGIRSVSDGNGGMRVRADIDWLLRPGMRAYNGETEILVDFINYYVPGNDQYMDVGESV